MKLIAFLSLFLPTIFTFHSCKANNKEVFFVDSLNTHVELKRFDKELHNYLVDPTSIKEDSLRLVYGDFLKAYGSVAINDLQSDGKDFFPKIRKYFSNPQLDQLYTDVLTTFADMSEYEKELYEVNVLIQNNFQGKHLPVLYAYVSGLKSNTIVLQNGIGISLDKYLGEDYPLYTQFFEKYKRIQMTPRMLIRDLVKAWVMTEMPISNKKKDLLSNMVVQGKVIYILSQLLPTWKEQDLIGYTPQQWEWAETNEKRIWKQMIQQNQLFTTEYMDILKYMEDAPYTSAVSTESPGRLGIWMGWQIVSSYVNNTHTSLEQLLKETDSQKILKLSKYNP